MATLGRWGFVAGGGGVMTNVTLHAAAKINYQAPVAADSLAMQNRTCAFGSGTPGRRQLRLRGWLGTLRG